MTSLATASLTAGSTVLFAAAGVAPFFACVLLLAGRHFTRMRPVVDDQEREIAALLRALRRAEDLNASLEQRVGIDWDLSGFECYPPPPSFDVAAEEPVRIARPHLTEVADRHTSRDGDRP